MGGGPTLSGPNASDGPSATDASALAALDRRSLLHPFTSIAEHAGASAPVIVRGEGVHLYDDAGRRYLDAAAGLWCVNIGHGHPRVAAAIGEQAGRLEFSHIFSSFSNEPAARLAARILELAGPRYARVFFGLSGSDANETNVKLAWYYNQLRGEPRRRKIISRLRGYHGSTVLTARLTGLDNLHRHFELPSDLVRHTDAPDTLRALRSGQARSEAEYSAQLAARLDALIETEDPGTVAAFIAEPVMGAGGVIPPPAGYFEAIAAVLRKHDVLLIADEVITGFGRLGRWFGSEALAIEPDLVTVGKGLTSGYLPLSASLVGQRVWRVLEAESSRAGPLGHGFTYSGHPVAAAAGLANLAVLEDERLVQRVARLAPILRSVFIDRLGAHPRVGEIRTAGLLAGVELVADRATLEPLPAGAKLGPAIARDRLAQGVIVRALYPGDIIACSPPFVISEAQIEQIADALRAALDRMSPA